MDEMAKKQPKLSLKMSPFITGIFNCLYMKRKQQPNSISSNKGPVNTDLFASSDQVLQVHLITLRMDAGAHS